jgi:peptide/nickel transport system substrate-binding protein
LIVSNEGRTIIPLFADHVIAATDKLKYETPMAGHIEFDGGRGPEKWWFA